MNNTASMTRKAAPPVPRTQVPFSQNSFESAVSANPQNVNELPKPQNVVALENRISGKSRAHMPLPVPLEQTGVPGNSSAAPGNASQNTITTPPFSNYAVNGSTPSPIANNKSSSPLFAAGNKNGQLGLRGDIGSPSDNNGPSQQGFGHLGSPNPFQTTTHVSVPNSRKMRRQGSDSSNQFSTGDEKRTNNQNRVRFLLVFIFIFSFSKHLFQFNSLNLTQDSFNPSEFGPLIVSFFYHAVNVWNG